MIKTVEAASTNWHKDV